MSEPTNIILHAAADTETAVSLSEQLQTWGYRSSLLSFGGHSDEGTGSPVGAIRDAQACLMILGPSGHYPWNEEPLDSSFGLLLHTKPPGAPLFLVLLPGAPALEQRPRFLRRAQEVDLRGGVTKGKVENVLKHLVEAPMPIEETRPGLKDSAQDETPTRQNPLRILIFSAEPDDAPQLHLDRPLRNLRQYLHKTPAMYRVNIETATAARREDLTFDLNRSNPQVLHFMGHGGRWETLLFESNNGQGDRLAADGLVALVALFKKSLRLVYLDACFSRYLADQLIEHVPCVVGMRKAITNHAASLYCSDFYRALGFGRSVLWAHKQGQAGMHVFDSSDETTVPELLTSPDIDPDRYVLLPNE